MSGFVSTLSSGVITSYVFAQNADFSGNPDSSLQNGLVEDFQLWVGNTALNAGGSHINVLKLTPGPGIDLDIDLMAETLTVSNTGSGFLWTQVTNTIPANPIQIVKENGYICTGASQVTFLLPLAPAVGDSFGIISSTSTFTIQQNGSQSIRMGSGISTAGTGNLTSNTVGDAVEIIYVGSNVFLVRNSQGTLTLDFGL